VNKQHIQDRIEKCRQILEANPNSQIFAALAEAYRKLGDLKSALDACNDGLKIHPDYGSAYLVLAKIARDQKRYNDAETAAFRAIELEGRTRSAEILLSDIYLQTGKFRKAEELLNRLFEADPNNESVKKLRTLVRRASEAAAVDRPAPETTLTRPSTPAPAPNTAARPGPAPAASRAPDAAQPAPETGATEEALQWEDVLATLERYPHLLGKIAVGYDGMLLQTDLEVRSEAETAAAMAADLFGAVRTEWPVSSFGGLEQLLVETEQSSWWIWPFPDFLLVLWCDPGINMGPLRMRLHQLERSHPAQPHGGGS
jgi:tetratricopeptide (TPR) repeat protein